MKIDIFPHIMPAKYQEKLFKVMPSWFNKEYGNVFATKMLADLDARFKVMDQYENLVHVLTLAAPAIENVKDPIVAADLARLANDEMASLVAKYPDRFLAAAAALPMNNIDAALKEIDRAINDLHMKGIQIYSPINDKPLDSPEFMPIYEKMAHYDLPIWIHPERNSDYPDYRTENGTKFFINAIFGWPFETTMAMTRLVFSGVFDKWPNLKIITHHCGGMVPSYEQRINSLYGKYQAMMGAKYGLKKPVLDYYKLFFNDTAMYGGTPALMCGYAVFGEDHIVFATDMPLGDGGGGTLNTALVIESIERMDVPPSAKHKIFESNARKLLHLPGGK
jgi:predicted TIM-barrel fold metal-dependent hydrolase